MSRTVDGASVGRISVIVCIPEQAGRSVNGECAIHRTTACDPRLRIREPLTGPSYSRRRIFVHRRHCPFAPGDLEGTNSPVTASAFGLTRVRCMHLMHANDCRDAAQMVGAAQPGHGYGHGGRQHARPHPRRQYHNRAARTSTAFGFEQFGHVFEVGTVGLERKMAVPG